MTVRMVVLLIPYSSLLENSISNVDSGLDIRNVGVDFVEYIDKRLVFDLGNSTIR